MAIETGIYNNIRPVEVPDLMGIAGKAMSLKQMGMQNEALKKKMEIDDRDQKLEYAKKIQAMAYPTMESLAGMSEQERAAAYPSAMKQLAGEGVPMDNIPQDQDGNPMYDPAHFRNSYMTLKNSDFGLLREKAQLDNKKTVAEINNLNRKAMSPDDPFSRQIALINYRDEMSKRKEDEKMRRYANIPGYELQEGATPTEADAKEFKTSVEATAGVKNSLTKLRNLVEKHGSEMMPTQAKAEMKQYARDVQLNAKELYRLGVLTGPDLSLMEEITSKPTDFFTNLNPYGAAQSANALKNFEGILDDGLRTRARVRGFSSKGQASNQSNQSQGGGDPLLSSANAGNEGQAGKIKMISPKGKEVWVNQEDVGEAIASGGKRAK